MATLVLTTVGGAIGGPIGAAIGAIAGQAIDRELFKPKRREGPRLTDLAIQTSRYGAPTPVIFGTMRVAGCVVWATELQETRTTSGGGKGQAGSSQYSYSASFAVLLSARAILGVERIWADGKLLRGAAGDLKTAGRLRLHLGSEAQAADPLIAAAEGSALTPALRGCGYAVFEDLALADFGNRIPSLTFEVVAAPATIGEIGEALGAGLIDGAAALPLGGFAAHGDSVRAVLETLALASGATFAERNGRIVMRDGINDARAVLVDDGAGAEGSGARGVRTIAAIDAVPRAIAIGYHDPARDYQAGLQRARRPGPGTREDAIELPAAIAAEGAKMLAEAALARAIDARVTRTLRAAWPVQAWPGDTVTIASEAGRWRVRSLMIEQMVLDYALVREAGGAVVIAASAGRLAAAPDAVAGTTVLEAFELPPIDDALPATPRISIAAAGTGAGWRRAALLARLDDSGSWRETGSAQPAVIGRTLTALDAGQPWLRDDVTTIEIELAHAAMLVSGADDAGLDAGDNLALIGDELVQFGIATQIGARRWRIGRLLRGRRGSDAAGAVSGSRFVMLAAGTLAAMDVPLSAIGGTVRLMASGIGDSVPVEAGAAVNGRSVLPLSPVHLAARALADGGAWVSWIRRSRAGWRWSDGVDVPLSEEREAYRVTLASGADAATGFDVSEPGIMVSAAERAGGPVSVTIRQIGTHGLSAPASITF